MDAVDYRICRILTSAPNGQTMNTLIKKLLQNPEIAEMQSQKGESAFYQFIRRRVLKLEEDGLLTIQRNTKPLFLLARESTFDLIKREAKMRPDPGPEPLTMSWYRKKAIFTLANVQHVNKYRVTTNGGTLTPEELYNDIEFYFENYLDETENKMIILRAKDPGKVETEFIPIKYKHRFNSQGNKIDTLKKYETAFRKATQKYERGVFLTLTTDPKRFNSLYEANRHMSTAFHKFQRWLSKRLNARLNYIRIAEFTKSGLIHLHIIYFGRKFLLPHDEITQEWERLGQGSINYLYTLRNHNGKWIWGRRKPKDSKGKTAEDYLKKYLKKAIFSNDGQIWYWAFNARYSTYSRNLQPPHLCPICGSPLNHVGNGYFCTNDNCGYYFVNRHLYALWWICYYDDMPDFALISVQEHGGIPYWGKPPPNRAAGIFLMGAGLN